MTEEIWKKSSDYKPFGYNVNAPMQYRFTQDELRTFRECEEESFVQRSAPLGTMFGLASYFGVQKGYLKPNARFGAIPKVSLAVVLGYFLGKLSYQGQCAEKLMALPDSYIGQLLRERRDGLRKQQHRFPSKTELGVTEEDIYSDAGPGNSLDLDTTRPSFGDDTSYRPDIGSMPPSDDRTPKPPALSYEELRKRNRGENIRRDPYEMAPNEMPVVRRPVTKHPSPNTNKYGDEME